MLNKKDKKNMILRRKKKSQKNTILRQKKSKQVDFDLKKKDNFKQENHDFQTKTKHEKKHKKEDN